MELGPDTSSFTGKIAAQTGKSRRKTKWHEGKLKQPGQTTTITTVAATTVRPW